MRNRPIGSFVVVVTLLALSSVTFAQTAQPSGAAKAPTGKTQAFDPRDLTGIWVRGKAPQEKEWNDPMFQCEPAGYPRVMLQIFAPLMRFIQTSNEIVEFFEWGHTWRDIWTDGRKPLDNPEPTYFGYSVGRWDGDTFIVDSNIITLVDPKTYTKPWVSDKMFFDWAPKSPRSENEEFREDFCIYLDQANFFKNVDPVGAGDAPAKNKDQ